jgi:hypothetical protein
VALLALYFGRRRDAIGWFQQHFRWFYYLSALLFAAMHLMNFAAASPTLLPLVLPQLVLGLILGYLRVERGLATSIALHMLHNGLFVGAMLAGMK